ncbi:MAG: hypothetical protein VB045_00495 [Synergistaceae bacterium]|nr:hypothetical protein [Synergistaceae bacterium]
MNEREEDKIHIRDKELAIKILIRGDGCPPQIEPFFEITEGFFYKIRGSLDFHSLKTTLYSFENHGEQHFGKGEGVRLHGGIVKTIGLENVLNLKEDHRSSIALVNPFP